MEAKFDSTNNEQRAAYRMIERTNNSFFLAGRAGTGKTTFLKNVQEGIRKKFVVERNLNTVFSFRKSRSSVSFMAYLKNSSRNTM